MAKVVIGYTARASLAPPADQFTVQDRELLIQRNQTAEVRSPDFQKRIETVVELYQIDLQPLKEVSDVD